MLSKPFITNIYNRIEKRVLDFRISLCQDSYDSHNQNIASSKQLEIQGSFSN